MLTWWQDLLTAVGSTRVGGKWQCPAHATTGEHGTSLAVAEGDDGRVLLHCHAGCSWADVVRALGCHPTYLCQPPPVRAADYAADLDLPAFPAPKNTGGSPQANGYRFEAEHPYGHPAYAWKIRHRHPRTGQKRIAWESLNPRGERVPGLLGRREVDLPLYRERDVRMAVADPAEPVLLVESESSVDALVRAGFYATTWAGGAGSPSVGRIRELLAGHPGTVLIPDHDDAGRACADRLVRVGAVQHVLLGEPGEDARDLLTRLGPTAVRGLITAALRPTAARP